MNKEFLSSVIREAGSIVQSYFCNVDVMTKGVPENTVTQADFASEKYITEQIKLAFPEHLVLGEEGQQRVDLESEHLWVIDPLDGTNNFSCGMPFYSISIAYAQKGEVVVGAVYDPSRDELFYAEKGGGAFLNDNSISVSQRQSLAESLICTGFYYDRGSMMESTLSAIKELFHNGIRGLRRTGGAALDLCWTGAGRFDGFFEYELHPWDFAAGVLILREAGGLVCDRDGGEYSLSATGLITGQPTVFENLLEIVKWREGRLL